MRHEWKRYVAACYPEGLSIAQGKEVQQAFFAGALALGSKIEQMQNIEDDDWAETDYNRIRREVIHTCQQHKKRTDHAN